MAGAIGAHLSSTLHGYGAPFLVISVLTELVECKKLTKEVFYWWGGGGSRAGRATARFKLQPSATVGVRSNCRLTTRLGKTGAAWDVEHRRRVDGARGVSHAAQR
jgi:hypothetical protein